MPVTTEYLQGLDTERRKAWEQAKEILDRCAQDKRARTAEEDTMFERANADIDRLAEEIDAHLNLNRQEREADVAREAFKDIIAPEEQDRRTRNEVSALETWLRTGDTSGLNVREDRGIPYYDLDMSGPINMRRMIRNGADAAEVRAIYTDGGASGGSLEVPVGFHNTLYQYLEMSNKIRQISYVFTTESGNPMTFPTVATHGVGTQVSGQGTALAGTDPIFGTIRMDAYRYGQLVKVSNDAAQDVGFPLTDFVAQNIGRALGRVTATDYVTGSGSGKPNGVITAASGSVVTAGSLITASYEFLINLIHSVADEYRSSPSCGFLMNDSTAGTLRKLRSGNGGTEGNFLWTPTTTLAGVASLGQPGFLLEFPCYTDSNVAAQGSNAKSVAFGDWSTFYIRDSMGLRLERSDQRYFDTDEIGFRGVLRTDSDLIDTNAIKVLKQNVT